MEGEPVATEEALCVRHIRFLANISREDMAVREQTSTTRLFLRTRRDLVSEGIKASDRMIHRNTHYEIIGRNELPNLRDEIELIVQAKDR